jgi:hypothetical protein
MTPAETRCVMTQIATPARRRERLRAAGRAEREEAS